MTDDVRAALDDLVVSADLPAVSAAAVQAEATGRRRRRRLVSASLASVALLAAPLAWSGITEPAEDVVVEDTAGESDRDAAPEPAAPTGRLVSGKFELTYDGRRYDDSSDEALTSCDGLPGLRNTGFQLDSLPPIRSFLFAGSASQQGAAARCLEAMPAAIVSFEEDAFFVPVVVWETDLQGPGRLSLRTSPLRPSPGGWLEHDLIVINQGDEPLVLDLESLAQVMDGAIAASTGSCSAIATPGGGFACEYAKTDQVLAPGESAVTTLQLERDVPGLAAVESGTQTLTWTQQVTRPEGDTLGELTLTLTYEVLTAMASPVLEVVPRPPGETQTVQVFFSSTDPDANLCQDVVPVTREVPVTAAVATAALNELFRGPSPQEERDLKIDSVFTPETAGLLRSVRIDDGTAYVDLRHFDSLASPTIPLGIYGTSCGSGAFHSQMRATLTQFPTVREVRYAFDGDPRAFVEWMQGGCPDPIPAGDPCDPEPFG